MKTEDTCARRQKELAEGTYVMAITEELTMVIPNTVGLMRKNGARKIF